MNSIEKFMDGVRKAYVEDQTAKGIRASGASAESLRIETSEDGGKLYGSAYFYQQIFGRRPGAFPPIEAILAWMRVKGIEPRDEKTTERQLAFLIARKIANSGTDIYQGKRPALSIEDRVDDLKENFKREFLGEYRARMADRIRQIILASIMLVMLTCCTPRATIYKYGDLPAAKYPRTIRITYGSIVFFTIPISR